MARTRYIKPDFFNDDRLAQASLEARFLYIGLWGLMDCNGIFECEPAAIRKQIFGYDEYSKDDVIGFLDELIRLGRIQTQFLDGKIYGFCPTFKKHQTFHMREKPVHSMDLSGFNSSLVLDWCQHRASTVPAQLKLKRELKPKLELEPELKREFKPPTKTRWNASREKFADAPEEFSSGRTALEEIKTTPKEEKTSSLIAHYCEEFEKFYKTKWRPDGKSLGLAKGILKDFGLENSKALVSAFFQIRREDFTRKHHDWGTLKLNLNVVQVQSQKGRIIGTRDSKDLELAAHNQAVIERALSRGEISDGPT